MTASKIEIMTVVKDDAYGHGDFVLSRLLSDCGIRYFAVSNIDGVVLVREAGAKGQILILGYTPIGPIKKENDESEAFIE